MCGVQVNLQPHPIFYRPHLISYIPFLIFYIPHPIFYVPYLIYYVPYLIFYLPYLIFYVPYLIFSVRLTCDAAAVDTQSARPLPPCDISVELSQVATQTDLKLKFQPFHKPCNAHACSFDARHGYWRSYSDS